MSTPTMDSELLRGLLQGADLSRFGLSEVNGRVDLRGLSLTEPKHGPTTNVGSMQVAKLEGVTELRNVHWKSLDLSNSQLPSLRFFGCQIDKCVFEGAQCLDWRLWDTEISDCSFNKANFKDAALGGVDGTKRNAYRRVDFSGADLRGTAWVSCELSRCSFKHAKLTKVDFQGTVFTDCVFEGEFEDVLFYRTAFGGEAFPPNEMKGVDFSAAKLRFVEFRGLDMNDVRWPDNDEHLVVDDYVRVLDRLVAELKGRTDVGSKQAAAVMAMKRKWAGPRQHRGVIGLSELMQFGGSNTVELVKSIVARERTCS